MTDDYVRNKIRDALAATGNDRHDAQKLLITWAVRDPALLLGMTKAHLKAISAALVEHAMRARAEPADNGPDQIPAGAIEDIISGGGNPNNKRKYSNVPPPKSTERQASAMRKLAAAFTRKKT